MERFHKGEWTDIAPGLRASFPTKELALGYVGLLRAHEHAWAAYEYRRPQDIQWRLACITRTLTHPPPKHSAATAGSRK